MVRRRCRFVFFFVVEIEILFVIVTDHRLFVALENVFAIVEEDRRDRFDVHRRLFVHAMIKIDFQLHRPRFVVEGVTVQRLGRVDEEQKLTFADLIEKRLTNRSFEIGKFNQVIVFIRRRIGWFFVSRQVRRGRRTDQQQALVRFFHLNATENDVIFGLTVNERRAVARWSGAEHADRQWNESHLKVTFRRRAIEMNDGD